MMTVKFLTTILLGAGLGVAQQQPDLLGEPKIIPLWEGGAPGAVGSDDADKPTLTRYPAFGRGVSGTAVIVAPGGGYTALAMNHEGRQIANWLNAMGITAFVLKYRLSPRYQHPAQLNDAQRAVRLVRARATEFGVAADRIGMMGFSAGGHLTTMAGTHFQPGSPASPDPVERAASRPDFLILAYALVSFNPPYVTKAASAAERNFLGPNAGAKVHDDVAADLHVTSQTPPSFLFSTSADTVVVSENSVAFYLALHRAGVPAELHVFETGPHGIGLDLNDPAAGAWPLLLTNWLRGRGLLKP